MVARKFRKAAMKKKPGRRISNLLSHALASFSVFRQFPVIFPVAILMLIDEMNYSGINNVALPAYIYGLRPAC